MIGYALVGSNDLKKAKDFYDAVFGAVGVGAMFEHPSGGRVYGTSADKPCFAVVAPFDGRPASAGNGAMISFTMESRNLVDAIHAKAVALGGVDEGAPGLRGPAKNFYAAYFRDLDGNKFCAFRPG